MSLSITPDSAHPLPDSYDDQVASSFGENARVAASTAALLSELGMPFEMTEDDEKKRKHCSDLSIQPTKLRTIHPTYITEQLPYGYLPCCQSMTRPLWLMLLKPEPI